MKHNVVDCSFRLPGEKAAERVADVPCGFDPDKVASQQQPEASAADPARKPAASAKSRRE